MNPRCLTRSAKSNLAVVGRDGIEGQFADVGAALAEPLRVDDLLHLLERGTTVEQFAGARTTVAAVYFRVIFQKMRCKPQRFFAKVGGCGAVVAEDSHYVRGESRRRLRLNAGLRSSLQRHGNGEIAYSVGFGRRELAGADVDLDGR